MRNLYSEAMLSKAGGGVSICLTNIRGEGAPIKGYEDRAANSLRIVKLMEMIAAYANQLGTRKGAAVAWINILHWDSLSLIDARKIRSNTDPDHRLRTVNIGYVIPDIVIKKAQKNENIHFLCPYDVKKVLGKNWTEIDISEHYEDLIKDPRVRKDPRKEIGRAHV